MHKKLLLIPCLFLCLSALGKDYYLKASLGYGIPLGGRELVRATGNGTSYDEHIQGRLSAGKGLLFNLGGGNMCNEYIGWEVNAAGVLFGSSISSYKTTTSSYQKEERYRNINFTPTLRLAIPLPLSKQGFWSQTGMFARFGLVIPIINSGYIEYNESLNNNYSYKKEKVVNFFDPGFFAAIGLSADLSRRLSCFVEISGQNMNNKIKSSEVVRYTVNGVDELPSLSTSQCETRYHRKRVEETDNLPSQLDPNKPTNRLTSITPAHNVGLSMGVFWKL